ncbi:hypothetical protein KQX54_018391 [Cotesia glomerata]|uniref:Uncharacterized protein n=1 Tax=Cotesia glomerata TaxID=32391 RepID=A0AAV7HZ08_COTGL|nr:hypothetical protein KQX54_018391 [Cotesia glomerata]
MLQKWPLKKYPARNGYTCPSEDGGGIKLYVHCRSKSRRSSLVMVILTVLEQQVLVVFGRLVCVMVLICGTCGAVCLTNHDGIGRYATTCYPVEIILSGRRGSADHCLIRITGNLLLRLNLLFSNLLDC